MNLLQALELIKEPNYTTLEQSKHLTDLGLPSDSADLYYGKDGKVHFIDGSIPRSLLWATSCTPCWSVGQLIKIYLICNPYESDDDLMFTLTSGVEVPDLCNFVITWLEYLKPDFNKVNKIIG